MPALLNNLSNSVAAYYPAERSRYFAGSSKRVRYGYRANPLQCRKIPRLLPPQLRLISVLLTANPLHLLQL